MSVSVEVSALRHGSHEEQAFVAFALAATQADASVDVSTWSVGWIPRTAPAGGVASNVRSWLVARSSLLGIPARVTWAAPRAQIALLASGPLRLRIDMPGVVTIHNVTELARTGVPGYSAQRLVEPLRRAVGAGVLVHVLSQTAADAAVSLLELDRAAVVVALPGLATAPRSSGRSDSVGVVAGSDRAFDLATVDAIRSQGVPAELIDADGVSSSRPCVVIASPGDGFPFTAIEAMTCDTPVVAARTTTTTEILEGAAILVDSRAATDLGDAAAALATNNMTHGLAVAAGRARASDFSLRRRGPELISVLQRALATR